MVEGLGIRDTEVREGEGETRLEAKAGQRGGRKDGLRGAVAVELAVCRVGGDSSTIDWGPSPGMV